LGAPPAPASNTRQAEAHRATAPDAGAVAPTQALPMPLIPPDPAREEKVLFSLRRAIARAADAGTTNESPQLRRLRSIERAMAERAERRRLDAGAAENAATATGAGQGDRSPP
jgi:hypothetical protein